MKKQTKDSVLVGFALFAIFFGAGNLIFPAALGNITGDRWPVSLLATFLVAILLPILSVVSVASVGDTFVSITRPVGNWYYYVVNLFAMIGTGVLANIPRMSATAYELSVKQLVPQIPNYLFSLLFFGCVYLLGMDKSSFLDNIGKYLSPILLVLLLFIVLKGLTNPLGELIPARIDQPFSYAFLELYKTGDLLAGLLMSSLFIESVKQKGYHTLLEKKSIVIRASVVAGLSLLAVYGGLLVVGAFASSVYPATIPRTELLFSIVYTLLGKNGMLVLGLTVVLACLTTCVGMTAAAANFIKELVKDRLSYRASMLVVCGIGVTISSMGVEGIMDFSTPLFLAIYPSAIVMTLLAFFLKRAKTVQWYRFAVISALVVGILDSLNSLNVQAAAAIVDLLPFSEMGLGWIVPAVIAGGVGLLSGRMKQPLAGK
ncbi:branched-chain amino acid transport system II carrier protein [Enterococcus sp. AZ109]|uniref:branched-chain amino acid transport system II carrier protein n=1 Tax=Enterococcus sp. AZ109 TaxID=2774634 RepID=UPI003F28FB9D